MSGDRPASSHEVDAFTARVREHMNYNIRTHGHHPIGGYTPSAFRHYIRRRALFSTLAKLDFRSALDVGCAEGFFLDSIRARFGADVWGVDLSDAAVEKAHQRYDATVAAADALRLPAADGSFDLVYSTETIEHVIDAEKMVAELQRVARRWVVVTTPVSRTEHDHPPDLALAAQGHINNFDRPALRRLFGRDASIGSFRCNSTLALIVGVGRHLPPRIRDAFYALDELVSQRVGAAEHPLKPLRNRDWLVVADGTNGRGGEPEWRCPQCRGALDASDDGLRCAADSALFPFIAGTSAPDFVAAVPNE